jgi:hypothetical protein
MQLMSGNLGSGAQSIVLHQKAKGKTIGYVFQQLARKLNDVLPDGFSFEFDERDSEETLEAARIAREWAEAADKMGAALEPNQKRTLLSNQVEAVRDAISDTPRANDVSNQPYVAADDTTGAAPIAPSPTQPPQETAPAPQPIQQKDYATTQAMFVQDVGDLLMSASKSSPYLDRRAFGVTMRSFLKNYGLQAYKDGMAAGGTYVDTLDAEDNADYTGVFMAQAAYINGLADDVYNKKAVNPGNALSRAQMWGKSLQAFNDAGNMAANKNAMYRWDMAFFVEDHCSDCKRLNGQVHRIRNWKASGWMPKGSKLTCKGFRCQCRLERTTEKARGRF